jgi:tetratricopeptide (TPR) repeat protein
MPLLSKYLPHSWHVHQKSMLIRAKYRVFQGLQMVLFSCFICLLANGVLRAQSNNRAQAPTSQLSDFAGVVDGPTKSRVESLLLNIKDKTKIDFYIATVDTTEGGDISDYSLQLANQWNIGQLNSNTKSLLLVISVPSKTSFTRFSRVVQRSLPEGVLGEMSQRMRPLLSEGRFAEAIDQGVQLFARSIAQRVGINYQDLETASIAVGETASAVPQQPASEPPKTRPRVVSETPKSTEEETGSQTAPAEVKQPVKEPEVKETPKEPEVKETVKETSKEISDRPAETPPPEVTPSKKKTSSRAAVKPAKNAAASKKVNTLLDDEDEAEEVELTLTLPLAKRAVKLKEFLDTHPDSKARPRATELLLSTHAGLGDQYLKNGEVENGIKEFNLAIDEAEVSISDKLYSGVIAQIPSNIYLRGQTDAAFKAAEKIENKFGSDPKRLLGMVSFYVGIEKGDQAIRVAELVVKQAPDLAEAHRALALSKHINLQLDEAAAEYKRAVELDPTSKAATSSLADLSRATGKTEEALALYDELLKTDPKDRSATAGRVLCLLELGRKDDATSAIEAALAAEPRNLPMLAGTAYWYAAHDEYEKAVDMARKAIEIEPRYTWSHIALVRSLLALKRPVGAERAMRFAAQYGKFPTLNYELATVVASMGFYDEAAEILRPSFSYKDGQIETFLAGRIPTRDTNFMDLLAPERRASIYQPKAADSDGNSKTLTNLLALDSALTENSPGEKLDESIAAKTALDFGSGSDSMRSYRQLYAASRLLRKTIALSTALELVEEAKSGLDTALEVSVVTSAVQADEYRSLRAQAIASGNVPDIAEAPRTTLSSLMKGRIEDLTGWILFNQDKYPEAIDHLKTAVDTLPNGTPAWRNATWHLGVAYEQTGKNEEALSNYINSYNSGERDPIRRSVIERLYTKVNGSINGLDEKIGPSASSAGSTAPSESPTTVSSPTPTPTESQPSAVTSQPTSEVTTPKEKSQPETTKPETQPPTSEPSSAQTSSSTPPESPVPSQPEPPSEEQLRAAGSRLRSNIKITGRVLDSSGNALGNVTVVLISPSGSVLASTTDNEGKYSFTVTPSQKTYRLIPSKDGYAFLPIDKTFAGLIDDQRAINFVGSPTP